jgi:hypothetical protein
MTSPHQPRRRSAFPTLFDQTDQIGIVTAFGGGHSEGRTELVAYGPARRAVGATEWRSGK